MKKFFDPREYGGAPFLGLAKPVIKAHGSSDASAIKNAVRQAITYAETGVIEEIERQAANFTAPVSEAEKIRNKIWKGGTHMTAKGGSLPRNLCFLEEKIGYVFRKKNIYMRQCAIPPMPMRTSSTE